LLPEEIAQARFGDPRKLEKVRMLISLLDQVKKNPAGVRGPLKQAEKPEMYTNPYRELRW